MKLQSVLPLCGLFFLSGLQQVVSTTPLISDDHSNRGFSNDEENLCSAYCHKSVKFILAYTLELKEKIKALEQTHSEGENGQLTKAVESLQTKIEQQNIHIASIDDFITNTISSLRTENENIQKVNDEKSMEAKAKYENEITDLNRELKELTENLDEVQREAAKNMEERTAEENTLRNNIEQILADNKEEREEASNRQIQIESKLNDEIENLKEKLANQKANLDEAIIELALKKKELEEYHSKEKDSGDELKECKSDIISLKEKLEKSQSQLTDSKKELEEYLLKEKDSGDELNECKSDIFSLKKKLVDSKKELEEYLLKGKDSGDELNEFERHSQQLNQTEINLIKCQEKSSKTGCKGLPSGIHTVEIPGLKTIAPLCNGDIDGGGWIVIHKRFDGSVVFQRSWFEYRNGFGNKEGEFFIGLENLHRITNSQIYELYVQLGYFNGTFLFARYDNFRIGNEATKYKLESLGEFKGTARNAMSRDVNQAFSTFDHDNDQWKYGNCATRDGAWWHKDCSWM
ncbi:angiopoietin-1-like [Drosophila tropicalis]|uniref:angiopoietin-1-like n=1 Tax=Drosophila tropicalis TaxID=46794 RepID=UPI0035ABECAF